jgi:hypothetical protein
MRVTTLLLALACTAPFTLVGAAGCGATPTLPLPPPVASVSAPNALGLVLVEGDANARAFVYVYNTERDQARGARADQGGHYAIEMPAAIGDTLVIWQEDQDGLEGERVERVVPGPN